MKVNFSIEFRNFLLLLTVNCLLLTVLTGCAAVPRRPPQPPKGMSGIYHRVKASQTLWGISRAYGVELEKIARINRLADTSRIYVGQRIFIPEAPFAIEDLGLGINAKDKGGDFIWPLRGRVSSFFGMKKEEVKNKGVCIQTKKGAQVLASRSGKIAFCSEGLRGYGKIIIIDHLDGYSTIYAQNSKNLVKLNQLVKQGRVIAKAGLNSHTNSPELYFEIRKRHKPQNPFFYLP